MKFFDKTLDEIYDIVSEINDIIFNQTCKEPDFPTHQVTFTFSDWAGMFSFNDDDLFSTEDEPRIYLGEEIDDYEDVKLTLIRTINERIDKYKQISL